MEIKAIEPLYRKNRKLFINGKPITQTAAKEKCQEILQTKKELEGEDLVFVGSILMSWYFNYQEPIQIKVDLSSNGRNNCFYYLKKSGDWEDFSYIKALRNPNTNSIADLTSAFRYEISNQILDYKSQHQLIGNNEFHVDHVVPFKKLFDEFLKKHNLQEQDIELQEIEKNTREFKIHRHKIKDRKLAKAWQDYHKEKAELQILTATENLKKSSS
jgi:hypothetical protein